MRKSIFTSDLFLGFVDRYIRW